MKASSMRGARSAEMRGGTSRQRVRQGQRLSSGTGEVISGRAANTGRRRWGGGQGSGFCLAVRSDDLHTVK